MTKVLVALIIITLTKVGCLVAETKGSVAEHRCEFEASFVKMSFN